MPPMICQKEYFTQNEYMIYGTKDIALWAEKRFLTGQISSHSPMEVGSRTPGFLFLYDYLYANISYFRLADIPLGAPSGQVGTNRCLQDIG